ncbi:ADP-ribosylglycohydrolase family protein [Mycolicibacterium sp. 624]|uniref:ADP-ribosylglycohydrolase family protein n=1 Tax=Mycolicibacterium sp. 624 TaxID=3156314 RepID=UPI00339AEBFD
MSANRSDKAIGVILGAAVGDALGWPQEDRSNIVGGKAARDVEPRPQFRRWERNAGTRFARYVEPVAAGEYSDDTQLMLAVARSCLRGADWIEMFRAVELPQWPLYQRGGGGSVLRAAGCWARGRDPWSTATKQDRSTAVKYFDAGANGVAMRIAPHAIVTAAYDVDELLVRVLLDGLSTHGHPRALVGACIHALSIRFALSVESTLEYGALLDYLLAEQSWRNPQLILEVISPEWLKSYETAAYAGRGYSPADVWQETVNEVDVKLRAAREGMAHGALANDLETLQKIGCFDRDGGSGIVAAVAAAYVASRTATRPISGLLRTGFLRNADTDTIASMTGCILGAIHGTDWLNSLGTSVQDSEYIKHISVSLQAAVLHGDAERSAVFTPITEKLLKDWSTHLFNDVEVDSLPDGRAFEVLSVQQLPTKTDNYVARIFGRAGDGQTIVIDQVTRNPTEAFRRGSLAPSITMAPPTFRIIGLELPGAHLQESYDFYRNVLRLDCKIEGDRLTLSDSLSISSHRTEDAKPSGFTLSLAVEKIADAVAIFRQASGLDMTWTPGLDALSLTDPDGNQIRIVQAAADGETPDSRADGLVDPAENAPWRITHRRGMTYELSNVTDTPKFHVEVSGEGVLRNASAPRIDGRSGIGFMGLDAFGVGDAVEIRWHLRQDRSDEQRIWSGIKPPGSD